MFHCSCAAINSRSQRLERTQLLHTCLCLVPAFVVPTPGPLPEEQGTIQTV